MNNPGEITQLLVSWRKDRDVDAYNRLIPLVYEELRRIARAVSRRHQDKKDGEPTLGTTALIHQAYLNLIEEHEVDWKDRAHFLAIAAREMRRILIDYWRYKTAERRGGNQLHVDLEDVHLPVFGPSEDTLALHSALEKLQEEDEEAAHILDMRYFGGMTIEEVSEVLQLGHATIERRERYAKAYLRKILRASLTEGEGTFQLFSTPKSEP